MTTSLTKACLLGLESVSFIRHVRVDVIFVIMGERFFVQIKTIASSLRKAVSGKQSQTEF